VCSSDLVPRRGGVWRSALVESLVLALAVVATVQLRTSGQGGVALLVPGLIVAGVALLAARAVTPVAGLVARRALRRGRLGTGLAAIQLARRPGSHRLFVLLAVASALLAFVAAGIDVAGRARENRAEIATGAARVVTVDGVDASRLLSVTRRLDPQGKWAMAVVPVEQSDPDAPDLLAVDSTRLGVAEWRPEFLTGGTAAVPELARSLRGSLAEPFVFQGTRLSVELSRESAPADPPLDVTLLFSPLASGGEVGAVVKGLEFGRVTRTVEVDGCTGGCRFSGIFVHLERGEQLRLTVRAIRQLDPPRDVVTPAQLATRDRWRTSASVRHRSRVAS